jgi:hypothetical protein
MKFNPLEALKMKIRCSTNEVPRRLQRKFGYNIDSFGSIFKGEEKYVFAIENIGSGIVFYAADENDSYPFPYPSEIFEVIDNRIPSNWGIRTNIKEDDSGNVQSLFFLSFDDWVNNDNYFENLIDDDEMSVKIFRRNLRILIELDKSF